MIVKIKGKLWEKEKMVMMMMMDRYQGGTWQSPAVYGKYAFLGLFDP